MIKKFLSSILMATFILITIAPIANAAPVELCMLIDGSRSMTSGNFNLQIEGIARAVEDSTVVPQNGTVTISVIQFGTGTYLEVPPTVISNATVANNVAAAIRAISQEGGFTNIGGAINLAVSSGFTYSTSRQVIDISTDGDPNIGPDPLTARDNAVASGVDVLNAIGVGSGISQSFLESLVWPQPASAPYNDGFVILVDDFAGFEPPIKEKIKAETQPTGIPTLSEWGMIIMSLLLAGSAIWVIKRRQTA
jgi:hypothetical protein